MPNAPHIPMDLTPVPHIRTERLPLYARMLYAASELHANDDDAGSTGWRQRVKRETRRAFHRVEFGQLWSGPFTARQAAYVDREWETATSEQVAAELRDIIGAESRRADAAMSTSACIRAWSLRQ